MRNWHDVQHLSFDAFVSPDQLHMNDWSYACVAKLLAAAIAEAATRPVASAAAQPTQPRMRRSSATDRASAHTAVQRREHVLDDIVGMFEPDRNPHQAVADAELGALRRRQPLVRRRRRMGDQALGIAEIVADADQLERVLKAERGRSCRP